MTGIVQRLNSPQEASAPPPGSGTETLREADWLDEPFPHSMSPRRERSPWFHVFLFLATNIAVLLLLSVVIQLFGLNR